MWDLIKGLAEIEEDCINLHRIIKAFAEAIYCEDQLSLTRAVFAETMLRVGKNP